MLKGRGQAFTDFVDGLDAAIDDCDDSKDDRRCIERIKETKVVLTMGVFQGDGVDARVLDGLGQLEIGIRP